MCCLKHVSRMGVRGGVYHQYQLMFKLTFKGLKYKKSRNYHALLRTYLPAISGSVRHPRMFKTDPLLTNGAHLSSDLFFLMQVCHQGPFPDAVMLKDSAMLRTGPSHMTSFHACMWRYLIQGDISRLVSLLTCDVEMKTPTSGCMAPKPASLRYFMHLQIAI